MIHLIIATRNAHKVREIASILGGHFNCLPMTKLGKVPELVENGTTFEENATSKAKQLASWIESRPDARSFAGSNEKVFVVADDSGLEVDQLDGAPGVHSARFAAVDATALGNAKDADNNTKLIRLLRKVPGKKRTARFRCVLAVAPVPARTGRGSAPSATASRRARFKLFEGVCEGRLAFVVQGVRGFGYDPLFVPIGCHETFGELDESVKSRISHRAKALAKLKRYLLNKP